MSHDECVVYHVWVISEVSDDIEMLLMWQLVVYGNEMLRWQWMNVVRTCSWEDKVREMAVLELNR